MKTKRRLAASALTLALTAPLGAHAVAPLQLNM